MSIIETARLILRDLTPEDLDALYSLRGDATVMRYIGTGAPQTREQVQASITHNMELCEQNNFGRWAVIHKQDNKFIGWCGLTYLDTTPEIELGYGLAPEYWGKGFITEAALASLRYGFETLHVPRIVAVALPENIGSWRVMEKIGMKYEKRAHYYHSDVVYYAISRDDFMSRIEV